MPNCSPNEPRPNRFCRLCRRCRRNNRSRRGNKCGRSPDRRPRCSSRHAPPARRRDTRSSCSPTTDFAGVGVEANDFFLLFLGVWLVADLHVNFAVHHDWRRDAGGFGTISKARSRRFPDSTYRPGRFRARCGSDRGRASWASRRWSAANDLADESRAKQLIVGKCDNNSRAGSSQRHGGLPRCDPAEAGIRKAG